MPTNIPSEHVTSAEITRNFGYWQGRATQAPLVITHHGRPRFVLMAAEVWTEADRLASVPGEGDETDRLKCDLLMRHIDRGVLILGEDLKIREVSAPAAVVLGIDLAEMIGKSIDEIPPPFDFGSVVASLRHVVRTAEEAQFDVPAITRNDHLRVRAFGWPGGVALVLQLIDDAPDRLLSHQIALEKAHRAQAMATMVRLSIRGTIEAVDAAFALALGLAPEKLIGVRVTDLLAVSERVHARERLETVLSGRSNGNAVAFDTRVLAQSGDELDARVAIAPLLDGYAPTGALVIITISPASAPVTH